MTVQWPFDRWWGRYRPGLRQRTLRGPGGPFVVTQLRFREHEPDEAIVEALRREGFSAEAYAASLAAVDRQTSQGYPYTRARRLLEAAADPAQSLRSPDPAEQDQCDY